MHTWESPVRCAHRNLLETLEEELPNPDQRRSVVELVVEEFDIQFSEPDDEMIIAGQEVLEASAGAHANSLFARRAVIQEIWRAMSAKAFGR